MNCSVNELIRYMPSILKIYLGELDFAINMFNRFKKEPKEFVAIKLFINAGNLIIIMGEEDLPNTNKVDFSLKWKEILSELSGFEFLSEKTDVEILFGRLVVAFYRTYILQTVPGLREKGAQIGSTIEEMLAILALYGFDTHLFQATKHWIRDWENEGFSKELALKIKNL